MGSTIRFTGLSSGLDTQSVVDALLTSYQSKIDKQTANKTKAEWKQEIYTDLNSKLKTFKSSLTSLKTASNLCSAKTTTSQDGIISVKNATYNGDDSYSILVKQVATKANVNTMVMDTYTDSAGKEQKVTSSTQLDAIFGEGDATGRNAILTIGDAVVDLAECSTIQDIVNTVKSQDSDINIAFNDSISAFTISSTTTGATQSISLGTKDSNDATVGVTSGTEAYKALSALGIGFIQVENGSINFNDTYEGKNAIITYNNSLTFESDTNEIEINGLTFTAQNASDKTVTVSVAQDTEQMYEKIKTFIDSYNSLLSEITTKYYAESASSYDVLTDDEKEAMTDKEIETWENKIKNSLLRRDNTLKTLYDTFRGVMTTDYSNESGYNLNSSCSLLSQIGIASSDWSAQGKLTINEEKLKSAIATDGDKVANLISSIATSLESKLVNLSNTTSDYRSYGSFFNDKLVKQQILDYDDAVDKAQDKYDAMEDYYYTKFTAMEQSLNSLNSTSSLFSNL